MPAFLLIFLVRLGLPAVVVELLPYLIKYGPALYEVIRNLIKIIQDLENKKAAEGKPVVVVSNCPNMIPGYGPQGELILIENPEWSKLKK